MESLDKVLSMIAMLQDLIQHKWSANARLVKAIRQHEKAAEDEELRKLLHHILIANRFWFSLTTGRPFAVEEESNVPDSWEPLVALCRKTQAEELDWASHLTETELTRTVETPYIPGQRFSLAQAAMQVCMHSHGHRAQCATRLRFLGGTPPAVDFILWLKERWQPDWS